MAKTSGDSTSSRWSWFVASNLALAGEAMLAFALAVALGALLRRTLPALAGALAAFTVLLLVARWTVLDLTPASRTTATHFIAPTGSWVIGSGTGVPVLYHPGGQYWLLQLALLAVLLVLAAAAVATGWQATRSRAVQTAGPLDNSEERVRRIVEITARSAGRGRGAPGRSR